MAYNASDPHPMKILVAGGFGAGKTTLVGAVSETAALTTEEPLTQISLGTDNLSGTPDKTSTTVALDYGRITLADCGVVLHLFGTPGQDRFHYMWDELSYGALGAVVLADTRRFADCFGPIAFFEDREVPFLIAVNEFDGTEHHYGPTEVRDALGIAAHVPVVLCDARDRSSAKEVLSSLVRYRIAGIPARLLQ